MSQIPYVPLHKLRVMEHLLHKRMQFLRGQPTSMACAPQPWALLEQKESCLQLLFTHTCSSSLQLSFLLQSSCVQQHRRSKASLTPWERRPAQQAGSYFHVHLEGLYPGQGDSGLQAGAGHPFQRAHVSGEAQGAATCPALKLMSCL